MIDRTDSLRRIILRQPGVTAAAPYITGKGGIEHDQVQEGVLFTGVNDSLEPGVTDIAKSVIFGRFKLGPMKSNRDRVWPGIVVGTGLADQLGVREGSEVVLMTLARTPGGVDPTPRMSRFTVAGVFETGMYEYDLNLVYISISEAQNLLNARASRASR